MDKQADSARRNCRRRRKHREHEEISVRAKAEYVFAAEKHIFHIDAGIQIRQGR